MALKRGSTGASVKELQKSLNASGAKLVVDGIFGPATQAAVRKYQGDNGLAQDGVVGSKTSAALGLSGSTTDGGSDPVATSSEGSELNLPGNAKLWYNSDTKQYVVVYIIPPVKKSDGTMTEELYVSWNVGSDEDLEAVVGTDVDAEASRVLTDAEMTEMGVVNFGGVAELRDFDEDNIVGDPLETWAADMEKMAAARPWILDDDWQQLTLMAIMERDDAQLHDYEIYSTDWYKTHSDLERRWMETVNADPATAERWRADSRAATEVLLREAGINNVPDSIIQFLSDKVVTGAWSTEKLDKQIKTLADPYSYIDPDAELISMMKEFKWKPDQTREEEDTVRSLLNKWLGPAFGVWSDAQIEQKAGALRNDPDAELEFIEMLKDQRVALLPGNDNRETSYQDLAQPWKNFQRQAWGTQTVDETDPIFLQMLRQNDARLAGSLLNREGLKRNVGKVVNDTRNAMTEAFGGAQY